MGRPRKQFELFKDTITHMYIIQNMTAKDIVKYLAENEDFLTSERALKSILHQWNLTKRIYTKDTSELRLRIIVCLTHLALNDDEILYVLQSEGYTIALRRMQSIRRELGYSRSITSIEAISSANETLRQAISLELNSRIPAQYGREYMYRHLKAKGIPVARDRMFSIMRELDPIGISARTHGQRNHKGHYRVLGPNWVWSIDGHLKFKSYGIEIYAAIDGYSRYIVWIYVGVSATTAIGILSQYITTLELGGVRPRFLRSDHGTETPLVANAQWQFAKLNDSNNNLPFNKTHLYGTSMRNQRIEAWWDLMTRGQSEMWKCLFSRLKGENYLDIDSIADRLAIAYIYLPILRSHIYHFAHVWNIHKIRKQRNRPFMVPGKPILNYIYPEIKNPQVKNYGTKPHSGLLTDLKNCVSDYDPDIILPVETWDWCTNCLVSNHFNLPITLEQREIDGGDTHIQAYLYLRDKIRIHMRTNINPTLELTKNPTGAYTWLAERGGLNQPCNNEEEGIVFEGESGGEE